MSARSEFHECLHRLIGHHSSSSNFISGQMTSLQAQLTQNLASRLSKQSGRFEQGFTLVELLIVVVIVGILSAVALPQFFSQTKKAAATEGTQTASSIAKQAAAYYLEQGSLGTVDKSCETYAGKLNTTNTNFTYECSGDKTAFVVTAKGKARTTTPTASRLNSLEISPMEPSRSRK